MPKLDPTAGLDGLYFLARHLVDGLYTGNHASPLRGAGIEFHDYRPYTPGDDVRTIDWKLFGRTDRHYLKRYRRETELNMLVAIDSSASMDFTQIHGGRQGEQHSKFAIAQRLAAALTTLAIRQGDRAGLTLFDKQLRTLHPATGSMRRLQTMIADLDRARPSEGQADLAASLGQLVHTLRGRKHAVIVISDFLDESEPILSAMDQLRFAGHEVVAFQVLTPDEIALNADARGLRMIEPEAGQAVNTQTREIAHRYKTLIEAHLKTIQRSLAARSIDHIMVNTRDDMIGILRRYLMRRSARRS